MKKLSKETIHVLVIYANQVVDRAIVSEVQTNSLSLACDLLIMNDRHTYQLPQGSIIQFKYSVCVMFNSFNFSSVFQRITALGGHSNTIVPCTSVGNPRPAYSSSLAPKTNLCIICTPVTLNKGAPLEPFPKKKSNMASEGSVMTFPLMVQYIF